MQTIARATRVFRDKANSLIVDYVDNRAPVNHYVTMYGVPAREVSQ